MKINYLKNWGKDGTVYDQTVTIDKTLMEQFNNYILDLKTNIDLKFTLKHTYSENDLKIKSVDYLTTGFNYTNLIVLNLFIVFCQKNNIDITRLLYRNTIIKVI